MAGRTVDGAQEARFVAYAQGIGLRRALACLSALAEAERSRAERDMLLCSSSDVGFSYAGLRAQRMSKLTAALARLADEPGLEE